MKKFLTIQVISIFLACSVISSASLAEDAEDMYMAKDPLEKVNRVIYGFNNLLDKMLFRPIAKGYSVIMPDMAKKGVRNVLNNLSEPVTFVNSVLQRDQKHSFTTFWRFSINTTFGLGGIFDVAKDAGLKARKEDFGQTLGVYGAGTGPYIMLPILGPSNTRDVVGKVADTFSDPFTYLFSDEANLIHAGVRGLDARESTLDLTDHIEKTSLDPYATIRSLYTQKRADDIRNGKIRY